MKCISIFEDSDWVVLAFVLIIVAAIYAERNVIDAGNGLAH